MKYDENPEELCDAINEIFDQECGLSKLTKTKQEG